MSSSTYGEEGYLTSLLQATRRLIFISDKFPMVRDLNLDFPITQPLSRLWKDCCNAVFQFQSHIVSFHLPSCVLDSAIFIVEFPFCAIACPGSAHELYITVAGEISNSSTP